MIVDYHHHLHQEMYSWKQYGAVDTYYLEPKIICRYMNSEATLA